MLLAAIGAGSQALSAQEQPEVVYVKCYVAYLKTEPDALWADEIREVPLEEGTEVKVLAVVGEFYRVTIAKHKGYLHISEVTRDPDERDRQRDDRQISARGQGEVSAGTIAARGLSPEMEREYQKSNKELRSAFRLVDEIEFYGRLDAGNLEKLRELRYSEDPKKLGKLEEYDKELRGPIDQEMRKETVEFARKGDLGKPPRVEP